MKEGRGKRHSWGEPALRRCRSIILSCSIFRKPTCVAVTVRDFGVTVIRLALLSSDGDSSRLAARIFNSALALQFEYCLGVTRLVTAMMAELRRGLYSQLQVATFQADMSWLATANAHQSPPNEHDSSSEVQHALSVMRYTVMRASGRATDTAN